jgi:type VI protein secretion system component VasK
MPERGWWVLLYAYIAASSLFLVVRPLLAVDATVITPDRALAAGSLIVGIATFILVRRQIKIAEAQKTIAEDQKKIAEREIKLVEQQGEILERQDKLLHERAKLIIWATVELTRLRG